MDSCTKCQFTEGEDNFLVRLASDPDVCFTEHQCIQDGKIPNRESWVCEEDENATGGKHLSDAELFEQGEDELVKEKMDTYPLVNAMNKEAGGKSMNKKATAKLLKDNMEDNKKAYEEVQQAYEAHPDAPIIEGGTEEEALLEKLSKDGNSDGNSAEADTAKTSPSRLSFDSEDGATITTKNGITTITTKKSTTATDTSLSLVELKSTLKEAMHVAAHEDIPGIDQVCTMYKEGWVNNQDIHRMVGGVIFGYSEGKDTGLQTELDKQNSFGTIFTAARDWDKKNKHSKGIGKKIGAYLDEKKSGKKGDSIWCQIMVTVESLETKINDNSNLRKFTKAAKSIITFLKKTIGGHKLIKKVLAMMQKVNDWVEKMRKKWVRLIIIFLLFCTPDVPYGADIRTT